MATPSTFSFNLDTPPTFTRTNSVSADSAALNATAVSMMRSPSGRSRLNAFSTTERPSMDSLD
ncbi:hypothetical protein HDU81_011140, partial [Chytriomyces hyalinus]